MRRLAWFTAVVLATLALTLLIWELRSAVWIFILSLLTAATFRPFISKLTTRGVPLKLAFVIVYLLGFSFIVGTLWAISAALIQDLHVVGNELAVAYEQLVVLWPEGSPLQQAIAGQLPPLADLTAELVGDNGTAIVPRILGISASLFGALSALVLIFVLSVYWSADRVRAEQLWLSLIPIKQRGQARKIWQAIEDGVGAYVRSEMVQALLAGLLLGLGYWLIGIDYPVLLGLVGALAWLIPLMGAILALVPVIVLVGLSSSVPIALATLLYTLLIFLMLEFVLEPRLLRHQRSNSLLLVLVMITLVDALGLIGLIIAPPLTAAIRILFSHLLWQQSAGTADDSVPKLVDLKTKLEAVRQSLADKEESSSHELVNLTQRLNHLLEEAIELSPPESPSPLPQISSPSDKTLSPASNGEQAKNKVKI